ncbi:MAG: hypothetical protein ACSLFI_04965 [Solirubrobacterales bacterium]
MNAVDSFRIDLPASWRQLPLDLPGLKAELAGDHQDQAWQRLDPVERRRLDLYLQRLLVDIESADARFVSVYSELIDTPDGPADDTPLVASCIVSLLDRQTVGSDLPLTCSVIQAAMSIIDADEPALANQRTTNLAEPTIVELAHVSAVLVKRLLEIRYSKNDVLSVASETYFVPIADAFEQVIVVQFSTPNLEDAAIFSELFAEIAGTITTYREGEETIL